MACTLNKESWEKLIDEDIDWLDKQPDTLECKHIRQILEWTKTHRPDKQVEQLEAENKRQCTWSVDEDGAWYTDCGNRFQFTTNGPKENHFKHCPYCGGHLIEKGGA